MYTLFVPCTAPFAPLRWLLFCHTQHLAHAAGQCFPQGCSRLCSCISCLAMRESGRPPRQTEKLVLPIAPGVPKMLARVVSWLVS